jgi:predicted signal transduction protein with EAL and GGDEF domain
MAEALIVFARRTGIGLVAEGIETERELEVMRRLGVPLGQGFLIQRPAEPRTVPRIAEHIAAAAPSAAWSATPDAFARYSARVGRSLRRPRRPAPGTSVEPAPAEQTAIRH